MHVMFMFTAWERAVFDLGQHSARCLNFFVVSNGRGGWRQIIRTHLVMLLSLLFFSFVRGGARNIVRVCLTAVRSLSHLYHGRHSTAPNVANEALLCASSLDLLVKTCRSEVPGVTSSDHTSII
jgi:hypothetical protein